MDVAVLQQNTDLYFFGQDFKLFRGPALLVQTLLNQVAGSGQLWFPTGPPGGSREIILNYFG